MGEGSKIEWTDETFNPWRGCTKVSEGCKNCYAERLSGRNPAIFGVWGDSGTRVVASEAMWRQPLKWAEKWRRTGCRGRVFCASLADWLEDRTEWIEPRKRLIDLIYTTSDALEWLLLTKRPENLGKLICGAECQQLELAKARLGVSVESQEHVGRIVELLKRWDGPNFVSAEPLLGSIRLECGNCPGDTHGSGQPTDCWLPDKLHWVIVGGESGPGARPMHPQWARDVRDQCAAVGIPYFFKQHGEWVDQDNCGPCSVPGRRENNPLIALPWGEGQPVMYRVGKKAAGATLDGREHKEFPR